MPGDYIIMAHHDTWKFERVRFFCCSKTFYFIQSWKVENHFFNIYDLHKFGVWEQINLNFALKNSYLLTSKQKN